jgi:hypothetical protein
MAGLHYFHPDWIKTTDEQLSVDLCIYGGNAAGVAAAVTARKRGLSVALLQPGQHLGGMTSGGLGWTDFGRKHVIGGLSRSFYREVGKHYGLEEEWQFEPGVAEAIFDRWIDEYDVMLRREQYVDQVEMYGNRIHAITLLGGLRVQAALFMDCSYEGDLMAKAGVNYHVGREANSIYGESLNGIQIREKHQFNSPVDPYLVAGDPSSGLLPQVEDLDLTQKQGEGDHRVQAYNFRVCMTDDPELKVDWQKPENFDPQQYVLATRWFQSEKDAFNEQLRDFDGETRIAKFDQFPNKTPGGYHKTDTNNHGAVSSDFIGANWGWPEADYAERERLFQAHVTYQQGLYWHLANSEEIPQRYRELYQRWGLPKDEFTDTGHWPHQLYVREARRMIGDYVITEHDCHKKSVAEDSVGMGSYTMDSHNCTRFVKVEDGQARVLNEGDVQVPPTDPYPISYRSIVPAKGQCENLFVPVCFSASHIAYGSARMEPVFMVMGESAGIAAALCLSKNCTVQDLPYGDLEPELVKAEQVLR